MRAKRDGVDVGTQVIGERPAGEIPADHALVTLARDCLEAEGITPSLTSGSTDANIPLSRGIPAIVLGITTGSGAHTPHEYIDTAPVAKGMRQIANFVARLLHT
jgi:acetylornithine deacetylase/succinyl-diaminopimelate desuccinylase-like protein